MPVGKPAPPPRSGSLEGVYNVLRLHLGKNLAQGGVAVEGDVLVDVFRVYDSAVAEGDALLLIKAGVVKELTALGSPAVEQTLNNPALQDMLSTISLTSSILTAL